MCVVVIIISQDSVPQLFQWNLVSSHQLQSTFQSECKVTVSISSTRCAHHLFIQSQLNNQVDSRIVLHSREGEMISSVSRCREDSFGDVHRLARVQPHHIERDDSVRLRKGCVSLNVKVDTSWYRFQVGVTYPGLKSCCIYSGNQFIANLLFIVSV